METKNSNYNSTSLKIRGLVQMGLLSALTFVAAWAIHIPYGNGGVIHLGDSMIFLTAVVFGRKYAALSGALGMTMFDILSGFSVWAPYTFVIKAGMGLIAGSIANLGGSKGESSVKNGLGMFAAGIWMIMGYYAAEAVITWNITLPLFSILGNVIQVGAGAAIAFVIIAAIKNKF
ncbi:MAG: ECF transporter S component [Clostridiaceae bacterium]|nr:ECF transporter S component [Clostridiaceae bacterium]